MENGGEAFRMDDSSQDLLFELFLNAAGQVLDKTLLFVCKLSLFAGELWWSWLNAEEKKARFQVDPTEVLWTTTSHKVK